jgi:hypothetical protein
MDADGSNPIRIADETVAMSPQCSPDGKWVIYLQGASLFPMRVTITGEKPPEVIAKSQATYIGDVLAFSPEASGSHMLPRRNLPSSTPVHRDQIS